MNDPIMTAVIFMLVTAVAVLVGGLLVVMLLAHAFAV